MKLEVTRRSVFIRARSFELFVHASGHMHTAGRSPDGSQVLHLGRLEVVYSSRPVVSAVAEQATN